MRRKLWLSAALGALVLALGVATVAIAHGGGQRHGLKANLTGYQETPSIISPATGRFKAKINGSQIDYKLSYSGFTSPVHFAHIHLGQFGVAGGVAAFLCGGGGKPDCPQGSGEVSGTIAAADVQAIAAQGLAAGDIAALIDAVRHGVTYANVHTDNFAGGEIRGQIGPGKGHGFYGQAVGHGSEGKGKHGHGHGHGHGND